MMRRVAVFAACALLGLGVALAFMLKPAGAAGWAGGLSTTEEAEEATAEPEFEPLSAGGFEVELLVDGRPLEEYYARGKRYVEALAGAEYEVRIRNPLGTRVAVALSVDGLNTIDARRTSASDASKWVIEPYQTITITGWQMNSERARRFYFTTERDSYGAKLGQTANLGLVTAVFFRERQPIGIVTPPPRRPRPLEDGSGDQPREKSGSAPSASSNSEGRSRDGAMTRRSESYPPPDDDYAATGIGRNVRNDVRWVNLDLESRPVSEVTIRYEYREALIRLGVIPRRYPSPDPLGRRERATGFSDRTYCPEP